MRMVLLAASLAIVVTVAGQGQHSPSAERPYLAAARDAARWIDAAAIKTPHGVTWPANPADPKSVGTTLYSGSPGVILFMLEMHRATGEPSYLERARLGADHLIGTIEQEKETG